MNQTSFYCTQCQQMKLFQRPEMNHTPHILASVFLCGLWLPVWAITAASYNPLWRCSFCGFTDNTEYLVNPNLRQQREVAAAQTHQVRAQISKEREGSTIQERIAYFISDYKTALICVGVLAGMIGFAGFGLMLSAPKRADVNPQTANATPELSAQDRAGLATRDIFMATARERYVKDYPNLICKASGPKGETVYISHPKINKTFVEKFRQASNVTDLKKIGFTGAQINGVGGSEWRINF